MVLLSSGPYVEGCITEVGHWMSANRLKTELVWTGSRHKLSLLGGCGPSLQLGDDVIKPSDHVRLLGVTIAAELSRDKHVSNVCKTCFFWLRQLRRVCRSLDIESVKTLVHAFVTSRVDYCNSVLSSTPKKVTDKLQHVQNAVARLVTGTRKYKDGLSRLMHSDLHWLVIPQRVYKLAVTVHRCLRHLAPRYLADYCVPISAVAGRQHLQCARCHQLSVPRVRRNTFGTRAFSVAGPRVWDPAVDPEQFRRDLKTYPFAGQSKR